jgi:nitrite reductase/ring-hydroxylating ferredoxin subunit
MKIICTDKISGKRIAVSDVECPNYKVEYNDADGKSFVEVKAKAVEVKAPKVKKAPAKKKKATKKTK